MHATSHSVSPLWQTPHSGYHWDGSDRRFFEGWYFRLTLPTCGETLAFMYSIDDPAGGQPFSGGCAQILGPHDTYLCRPLPNVGTFWASRTELGLGHWRRATAGRSPRYLPPAEFFDQVQEGYQVTATQHQGRLYDPTTNQWVEWNYRVEPVDGWGDRHHPQRATAGWLSYLPVFEPGWQVLMAHGWATGWVEWLGQRYEFTQAPVYAEKNWGGAFPQKWFWVQCNAFEHEPDLSVTSAGGLRQVLGRTESVGLIGLHHQGRFYEFGSTQNPFQWAIQPWGEWQVSASRGPYSVSLRGACDRPGTLVRVPTAQGLQFLCRDTTHGHLSLHLQERRGDRLHTLIQATSELAGLEVGGSPWEEGFYGMR